MKKYAAIFKIFNGECTYTMPVCREAKDKEEAKKIFAEYVCDEGHEIWQLEYFEEVKTFEELWDMVK